MFHFAMFLLINQSNINCVDLFTILSAMLGVIPFKETCTPTSLYHSSDNSEMIMPLQLNKQ